MKEQHKNQQREINEHQKYLKEQQRKINGQDKKLKDQEDIIKEQQKRLGENDNLLLAVYANELEWTAGKGDPDSRYTRNAIIHGGNIKYAIRAIEFLREHGDSTRVRNASKGFAITYGISIAQIQPIFAATPEEVVDLLNKRGVLQKVWKWEEVYPTYKKEWIQDCDLVIQKWLQLGGKSNLEDNLKEDFIRLSRWVADRVDIIKSY